MTEKIYAPYLQTLPQRLYSIIQIFDKCGVTVLTNLLMRVYNLSDNQG